MKNQGNQDAEIARGTSIWDALVWIFIGFLLLMIGFFLVEGGIFSAFILLIAVVAICPPVVSSLRSRGKWPGSRLVRWPIFVFAFSFAFSLAPETQTKVESGIDAELRAKAERSMAARTEQKQIRKKELAEQEKQAAEKQAEVFGWMKTVTQHCADYRAAPNAIKKNEIAAKQQRFLAGVTITEGRGTLKAIKKLAFRQGGDVFKVVIKVGDATFTTLENYSDVNEMLRLGIRAGKLITPGSKLYEQVSKLREGQCVEFSTGKGQIRDDLFDHTERSVCGMNIIMPNLKTVTGCQ